MLIALSFFTPLLFLTISLDSNSDIPATGNDLFYEETLVVTAPEETPTMAVVTEPTANLTEVVTIESNSGNRLLGQLAELPGLEVTSLGPGQRQTISMRGSSAQQLLVSYNGIPLNSSLGGGADLSLFMLDQLDKVVVGRGVSGAAAGDGAMAGRIDLLGESLLDPANKSGAKVRLTAGSMNSWDLNGKGRYLWKRGGLQLSLGGRRSDGQFNYVDDNGSKRLRTNNDSRQLGSTLAFEQRLHGPHTLSLLAHVTASDRGVAGPYQLESFTARQTAIKSLLGVQGKLQPRWKMAPEFTIDGQLRFEQLHFKDLKPSFGKPIDELDRVLNSQIGFTIAFSPHSSQRLGVTGKMGIDQLWQSTFAKLRLTYQVTIFDQMDFIGERLLVDIKTAILGNEGQYLLLPEVGSRWRFIYKQGGVKELSLFLHGGRAGRFPSFYELYIYQEGLKPNANLNAESSWEVSGGLLFKHDQLQAQLSGFYRWLDNLILFVPVTATIIEAQNFSASRAYGLESSFSGKWYLTWNLSYTFTKTTFGDGGSLSLPGHPRHRGAVKLGYDIAAYKSTVADRSVIITPWAKVLWQSGMFLDRMNNLEEEGRALVSTGVDAQLPLGFRFGFWIDNLFNKLDAVDSLQYPLAGRTYWVTVSGGYQVN